MLTHIEGSQTVFLRDREPDWRPSTIASGLLLVRKGILPAPRLDENTIHPMTPEDLLVRNLARMRAGARVVLLIHGAEGFVNKKEHWREFDESWPKLDTQIEIVTHSGLGSNERWEVLDHPANIFPRKWHQFNLKKLIKEYDLGKEERDPFYQEWVEAMES